MPKHNGGYSRRVLEQKGGIVMKFMVLRARFTRANCFFASRWRVVEENCHESRLPSVRAIQAT